MRTLTTAFLLALLPVASAALGGKYCQIADSAVPTPGLAELVMGSKTDRVPDGARLTEAQIETLADLDTTLRRTLEGIDARAAKLPAGKGKGAASSEDLARAALPALVTRFLADAIRERALVIDVETAGEFRLANSEALAAKQAGDKSRWCPLCLGVRRGMEADFAWPAGKFGELSPAQAKEAVELAAMRDEVRRKWAAALRSELTPVQLSRLRETQSGWLKSTLHGAVASGMRSLGAKKCESCATTVEWKCEFCSIVLNALDEAKAKS